MNKINFAYFGGEPLGVPVLEELKAAGFLPSLIVASPDRKSGRGQKMESPAVKIWAEENDISVWQPNDFSDQTSCEEKLQNFDLFIVVAYNKILPEWLINLPKHKTLNVHPSLLPLLRGASPIRSAILRDMREKIGVSIMVLDKEMDHGPIVAQKRFEIDSDNWPIKGPVLDGILAQMGGRLLAATIKPYLEGQLQPTEQEHEYATYCGRFSKSDGELKIDPTDLPTGDRAYQYLLQIYGLMNSPGCYFIFKGKRIKINDAIIEDDKLEILSVTPEGKKAQTFFDFVQNL